MPREPLAGTAVTATSWLLVEVPGGWPPDVSDAAALPRKPRTEGVEHAVVVEEAEGPTVPVSCGADSEPLRTFEARLA